MEQEDPEDEAEWVRKISLYTGICAEMPESGWTIEGLTTDVTFDNFGDIQPGTALDYGTACNP